MTGPVLAHEARVLVVAADHPLAGRAEVTTDDIADYEVSDIRGLVPDSSSATRWSPSARPRAGR